MQIIQDIIQDLIQTDKSLTAPLFKAKFLANKITNQTLLDWVNNELNGYAIMRDERAENVPPYRKHGASLTGSYYIGHTPFEDMPLPTMGMDEEMGDFMRTITLYESVASLEKMSKEAGFEKLAFTIPPELCAFIQQNLRKTNPYVRLVSAKKVTSTTFIEQCITSIRSTFLDFMMELDAQFGGIANLDELKAKSEQITTIMNHTIINNSGDGALINTGNKSHIDSQIEVNKGNIETLAQKLSENHVAHEDITELQGILENDNPNQEKGTFGDKANIWISKMISKSLDGSWAIGIGASGKLLADAIKAYYGWH